MRWLSWKIKEDRNDKLSCGKYVAIESIILQESLVTEDICASIRALEENQLLIIYITNPLFCHLSQEYVRLHNCNILVYKFACPREDNKDVPDWVKAEADRLFDSVKRIVYEVGKLKNGKRVRFQLVTHPMIDLVRNFRAMCGDEEIIDVHSFSNDREVRDIVNNLVMDNVHIDKYLFWCDRAFKTLQTQNYCVDFTSLQIEFGDNIKAGNIKDKSDCTMWLSGHIDLRRWSLVTGDGITTDDDVYYKSRKWLIQSFRRFGNLDYSGSCFHVFNKNWSPPAGSRALNLSRDSESVAPISATPLRVATPRSVAPPPSSHRAKAAVSVRPKARTVANIRSTRKVPAIQPIRSPENVELNLSFTTAARSSPKARSSSPDVIIESDVEMSEQPIEGAVAVSPSPLPDYDSETSVQSEIHHEMPEDCMVIDQVGIYDCGHMDAPLGEENFILDNEKILLEDIRNHGLHDRHELVVAMSCRIRHTTPTFYTPKGAIEMNRLIQLPSVEVELMVRDMAYLRGIISPFASIVDPFRWQSNVVVENGLMFDLDFLPIYEGKMYLSSLKDIIKELEGVLSSVEWKSKMKFTKYVAGVQFYYRLVYYLVGLTRLDSANVHLSSIDCLKKTLASDETAYNFFIEFERAVTDSFGDLIEDVEKQRRVKTKYFTDYKERLNPQFILHLEKFVLVKELNNGPVLSGIFNEGNFSHLRRMVADKKEDAVDTGGWKEGYKDVWSRLGQRRKEEE